METMKELINELKTKIIQIKSLTDQSKSSELDEYIFSLLLKIKEVKDKSRK